jgi:MFS family permease
MNRHPHFFLTLYHLTDRPYALLSVVCLAEVVSMLSFAAWPLFLVKLQPLWGLSNFSVGWISGAYFIGYVLATPVLVGLTDRYDAKYIYIFSTLLAAAGAFGFALTAQGFWSAAFCWGLVGAGLAGTYMPGLQILNARLDDENRLRLLPYYTSAFGIGTGLSFFIMGWLYSYVNWTYAFIYAGIGSLLTGLLVSAVIRPQSVKSENNAPRRHPLDFRPAFRNAPAMRYILSYGAHNFELFAFRGWLFAYLIFAASYYGVQLSAEWLSGLISAMAFIGMVASVYGAKLCLSHGRAKIISRFGLVSFIMAAIFSLSGHVSFAFVLLCAAAYNITIMLDSASLTAGTVSKARPQDRGATLAVHTMIGFCGSAAGAPVTGLVLDLSGGQTSLMAWSATLVCMGVGSSLVWLIMRRNELS